MADRLLETPELERWVVVVPTPEIGQALRGALASRWAAGQAASTALLLPRIVVLANWVRSTDPDAPLARSEAQRRVELFTALKSTAWLTQRLGAVSGQLWGLARQLLGVCDELTLALGRPGPAADAPAIEARILAVLKGSYRERAWQICSEEAELVLSIWRSTLARDDPAALLLRGLERLAERAAAPLCIVVPLDAPPYIEAFLLRHAARQRVMRIEIDVAGSLAAVPALRAAWPELESDRDAPLEALAVRARELARSGAPIEHLRLMPHHSLEDEAACAAQTVLDWLEEGRHRIALVALDRLAARRVRALLERAQVLVRDEAGWKFSTATVAGSLMRWLELVHADEAGVEAAVLLDWVKSPHALGALKGKEGIVAELELAIRRDNVVRGWARVEQALVESRARLNRMPDGPGPSATNPLAEQALREARRQNVERALGLVERLRASAVPLRGRQSLAAHFDWLGQAMEATHMSPSFRADPVGCELLILLEKLGKELRTQPSQGGFRFAEWRDFVADALENTTFREQAIDSVVVTTSLAAATLRNFDAVLVLGADAAHFPGQAGDSLFLNAGLRVQLGLSDEQARQQTELAQLALLIAAAPRVTVTWRDVVKRHPNPVAGAIERLKMLHLAAFGVSLEAPWDWSRTQALTRASGRPAPAAQALVPAQVSASAYNTFLSCPYRYFVRYMLELKPLEEIREDAEKRDYGELVHRILERFHRLRPRPGERAEALALLEAVGEAVFRERAGTNAGFWGYQRRWNTLTASYIDWWIEWDHAGWQFARSELTLERELPLAEGAALRLYGRLDRLDRHAEKIAIVDYKARSKKVLQKDLEDPGEDVQLPFYRLLLPAEGSVEAGYLSIDRERVEWIGAGAQLEELSVAVAMRLGQDFHRLRQGWGLPANGADEVCGYCDARGLCRKGQWSVAVPGISADPPLAGKDC